MRLTVTDNEHKSPDPIEVIELVMLDFSLAPAPKGRMHQEDDFNDSKRDLVNFVTQHDGHVIGCKEDNYGYVDGEVLILLPQEAIEFLEDSDFVEKERPIADMDIAMIGWPEGDKPCTKKFKLDAAGNYTLHNDPLRRVYAPQIEFPEDRTAIDNAAIRREDGQSFLSLGLTI